MELVLISESKLKIVLSDDDMANLDITCDDIDFSDNSARRAFRELLDRARAQTGFDTSADKIIVRVYPDKEGGCSIYVTKGVGADTAEETPPVVYDYQKKYRSRMQSAVAKRNPALFRFADSETLYEACTQLMSTSAQPQSSSVMSDSAQLYLYIDDCKKSAAQILSEYGVQIKSPFFRFYLKEHAKELVARGAVEFFAGLYG